jgi:hypothetical protein
MREGTTSRVMAADRPYGEFYDFYSVNPKYFGYYLVRILTPTHSIQTHRQLSFKRKLNDSYCVRSVNESNIVKWTTGSNQTFYWENP